MFESLHYEMLGYYGKWLISYEKLSDTDRIDRIDKYPSIITTIP